MVLQWSNSTFKTILHLSFIEDGDPQSVKGLT
jgi:hypothetical protein